MQKISRMLRTIIISDDLVLSGEIQINSKFKTSKAVGYFYLLSDCDFAKTLMVMFVKTIG